MNNFQIPYLRFLMVGFLVLLTSLNNSATAQKASILQDAIELSRLMVDAPDSETQDYYLIKRDSIASVKAYEILRAYSGSPGAINPATINTGFKGNPFMGLEVDNIRYLNITPYKNSELEVASPNQADLNLASISSLPITPIATGLADFLVKRTKEELNIAFFNRLKKYLDGQKEAKLLFPHTHRDISLIGDQIYNWNKYLEALQVSFQRDLALLPENVIQLLNESDIFDPWRSQNSENLEVFSALVTASSGIVKQHISPIEVIPILAEELDTDPYGDYFKLLNALIYSSFWNPVDNSFLPEAMIARLLDRKVRILYLGLLYQRIHHFKIEGQSIARLLEEHKTEIIEAPSFFVRIGNQLAKIQQLRSTWKAASLDERKGEAINFSFQVVNDLNSLLGSGIRFAELLDSSLNLTKIKSIYQNIQWFSQIIIDVSVGNYSHAVIASSSIISSISGCDTSENKACKSLNKFLYYGSFMAAIVEAETSEEVSQLLDAYALPAGSASIKKSLAFSVSINSYVGFFGGCETILRETLPDTSLWVYGVTAPLGFGANLGFNRGGSASLYFSLIDIGSLVSYGFLSNDVSDVDSITLGEIWAPGIGLVYGFPGNVPLSIGVGYQWGPELREIPSTGNTELQSNGRLNVFLAVDIPILHLWNVPR